MCHFNVVLTKDFLQGFGEGGMVGEGDGEGVVGSLPVLSLSSGGLRNLRRTSSIIEVIRCGGKPLRRQMCLTV